MVPTYNTTGIINTTNFNYTSNLYTTGTSDTFISNTEDYTTATTYTSYTPENFIRFNRYYNIENSSSTDDKINLYWNFENSKFLYPARVSAEDKLKGIIRKRQGPNIICNRKPVPTANDIREIRARETLKRVLGARKFKNFISKGFITVKSKSGLIYQIYPGHGISRVYKDGKQIERLCVIMQGDFAPTDSLLMRYLMILSDENKFRSYAIKYNPYKDHSLSEKVDKRSLVDIFKDLKKVA